MSVRCYSLLRNLLADKNLRPTRQRQEAIRADKGKKSGAGFLMSPHLLTNILLST